MYSIKILETTPVNLTILTVSATDGDLTAPNNKLKFGIIEVGSDNFRIDATTGEISLRKSIDFESNLHNNNQFNLTVTVNDHGVPTRSSQSQVSVHIIDFNDNTPTFNNKRIEVRFDETNETGLFVTHGHCY